LTVTPCDAGSAHHRHEFSASWRLSGRFFIKRTWAPEFTAWWSALHVLAHVAGRQAKPPAVNSGAHLFCFELLPENINQHPVQLTNMEFCMMAGTLKFGKSFDNVIWCLFQNGIQN